MSQRIWARDIAHECIESLRGKLRRALWPPRDDDDALAGAVPTLRHTFAQIAIAKDDFGHLMVSARTKQLAATQRIVGDRFWRRAGDHDHSYATVPGRGY
jgi:hypothetical protein